MSVGVGVVTFAYRDGGFLRVPRDEIRGAQHQSLHTDGRGETVISIAVALSSVHPQSGWLLVTVGSRSDIGVGRERTPGDVAGLAGLVETAREMVGDLRDTIEIDVTWTQGLDFAWTRTEGRP